MNFIRKASLVLAVFAAVTQGASGASFDFLQEGWSEGGRLRLTFDGQDSNGDGSIEQGELNSFLATYTSQDDVPVVWSIGNIEPDGFFFSSVRDYLIFATNPDFSLVNTAFEGEALATVFDASLFPLDNTDALPASVPEPAGLIWIGMAVLGRVAWQRRKERTGRPVIRL